MGVRRRRVGVLLASGLLTVALTGTAGASPGPAPRTSAATVTAPVQQAMPGTWSLQANPLGTDDLTAVSCADTLHCMATGRSTPLVGRTTDGGGTWTLTATPPGMDRADAVACPSVARCYVVGTTTNQVDQSHALVMDVSTDVGTTWTTQAFPTGVTGSSGLTCPSAQVCVASTTFGIVATTNGGATWSGRSAPFPPAYVSCSSTTDCFGFEASGGAVERTTDGTTWTSMPSLPVPSVYLGTGASCPTATFCVVVGAGSSGYPSFPSSAVLLVTRDGGATWTRPSFPVTSWPVNGPGQGAGLGAVSCPSATVCYVRGVSGTGPIDDATTDGAVTWTGQDPVGGYPLTSDATGSATALSCPAVTDCFAVGTGVAHYAPTGPADVVAVVSTGDRAGYWMAASDGTVFHYGDAPFLGSMSGLPLVAPIVGLAGTPDGGGYWLVAADGGVFAFGDARFAGSMGGTTLTRPVVGSASTRDGGGYWLVAADGGVFAFGDARFAGSMGGTTLARPVVGLAADVVTGGYWLAAADGGVFSFDAPFRGSAGGTPLAAPVTGIAPDPSGTGYRLAAADGGVFSFGVPYLGSMVGLPLRGPVTSIADADGGYWLAAADGGLFAFGAARYLGSPSG